MYTFDAEKVKAELVAWIREWFANNGPTSPAVIGISGGKDSSVTAALCVEALGADRVIGVLMPNGTQSDIDMSRLLCTTLGIENYTINIANAVDGLLLPVGIATNNITEQARTNLPPRIRMATLYLVSQCFNGRVMNTCNLSEDWVGYSTRYGDSAGDVCPLAGLTKEEVCAVGRALNLPAVLVDKVPSDGLCGKTDEDNLGFTYAVLDRYIRTGEIDDMRAKEIIDRKHLWNKFKMKMPDRFVYAVDAWDGEI